MGCSRRVAFHLMRGGIGIILMLAAVYLAHRLPVAALLLGAGSLVAFGGCPTCWIAGLCETASAKKDVRREAVPGPLPTDESLV